MAGESGGGTLARALPWIFTGLSLRFWAFAHLGGQGRTRDASAPRRRVVSGPYAALNHPVYLGNLLLAGGIVIAARPPGWLAILSLTGVAGFYALLARREGVQVAGLAMRAGRVAGTRQVARIERSTWLTVAAVLLLASC